MTDVIIQNELSTVEINQTTDSIIITNTGNVDVSVDSVTHSVEINQSVEVVSVSSNEENITIVGNVQGPPGPKGEQGSSEATAIAGFPIEVAAPSNGDLLGFNGTVWSNVNKVQLTDGGNF